MGLGSANDVSLADARRLRWEQATVRAGGRDPLAIRDTARAARRAERTTKEAANDEQAKPSLTFDKAIDLAFEATKAKWTSGKHSDQWKDSLVRFAVPFVGHKSVTDINIEDVLAILRPIWTQTPETAFRLRARIEHVLSHAYSVLHHNSPLEAQRLIDVNPARRTSHLQYLLGVHDRTPQPFSTLPYSDVANFVGELRADGSVMAMATEFLLLTASRSGTVLGAAWSEINWDECLWTIPQGRMKHKRGGHRPWLSVMLSGLGR
jgi:integrase